MISVPLYAEEPQAANNGSDGSHNLKLLAIKTYF